MRLGEHCDYGTFTLLFQLDSEGLQVALLVKIHCIIILRYHFQSEQTVRQAGHVAVGYKTKQRYEISFSCESHPAESVLLQTCRCCVNIVHFSSKMQRRKSTFFFYTVNGEERWVLKRVLFICFEKR